MHVVAARDRWTGSSGLQYTQPGLQYYITIKYENHINTKAFAEMELA